jgi:Leucine-rich repeat (LRR) protein
MKVKIIFLLMGLFVFVFSKSSFSGNNSNADNIIVELTNEEKEKIIDDIQSKFPEIVLNKKQIIKYNKLKIQKYKRGNAIGKRMDELFVELMRCTWLRHIELKFAEITEIPSSIQNLCNLKVLDLSNNLIENLPEEIGCLVNLEILNLPDNQISGLPKSMNQLISLVVLNLSINYLDNMPGS